MGFNLGKALKGVISGAVSGGSVGGIPGAIAGGLLGGVSGTLDAYQDKQSMKYQQKQNIKLWNMQNAYNTPKAQMERFMDAKLNPNLIYSQNNEAGAIQGATLSDSNSDIGGQITTAYNNKLNTLQAYSSLANQAVSRQYTDAQIKNIAFQQELARDKFDLEKSMIPYQMALAYNTIQTGAYNRQTTAEKYKPMYEKMLDKSRSVGEIIGDWVGDKAYGLWKVYHSDYFPGGKYY